MWLYERFGEDTKFRKCIPLQKRIAIALYALGSSAEYQTVGGMFGVGKSTVGQLLITFCEEVWKILSPIYLNFFPLTKETIFDCVEGFEGLGYPQCLGAIDGCHVKIQPSKQDAVDYYNYKGWYSTILLALVDYRYRFMYINVGAPGRCNDSSLYERSALKRELENCRLLDEMSKPLAGTEVPVGIIGDSAFRLSRRLMKPYPYALSNSNDRIAFNRCLSQSRRVVENAFGHLKGRFRRIGKGIDNKMRNVNVVIKACCVLHNFLNNRNDSINKKWYKQTNEDTIHRSENFSIYDALPNTRAEAIRTAITLHLGARASGMGVVCPDDDGNVSSVSCMFSESGVVAEGAVGEHGEHGAVGEHGVVGDSGTMGGGSASGDAGAVDKGGSVGENAIFGDSGDSGCSLFGIGAHCADENREVFAGNKL